MNKKNKVEMDKLFKDAMVKENSELANVVKDIINMAMEAGCSYLKTKACTFDKDGKVSEKVEKEYVNGKCTKDERYSRDADKEETPEKKYITCGNKKAFNNNNVNPKKFGSDRKSYAELKKENEGYRKHYNELTSYIDGLNDKIKELTLENKNLKDEIEGLKKIIDNVKTICKY